MRYAIFALIASVMLGCSSYYRIESQCFQVFPIGPAGFLKFNQCNGDAVFVPLSSFFKDMEEKPIEQ